MKTLCKSQFATDISQFSSKPLDEILSPEQNATVVGVVESDGALYLLYIVDDEFDDIKDKKDKDKKPDKEI